MEAEARQILDPMPEHALICQSPLKKGPKTQKVEW
jgi:hypothetical protein